MKTLLRLLLVVCGLSLAGQAQAQTLTFDELPAPDATIMASVVCGDVSGFRFTSAHFHTLGPSITIDFTNNGTTHIGYESIRGFPIVMDRVNGGTFSLQSLDAGEFYFPARADHPDANVINITGTLAGGGTVTHQIAIDGLADGLGGIPDYQHFTLPSTFVNLTRVVFTGLTSGGLDGGIALDNLQYTLGTAGVVSACVSTPAVLPAGPTVTLTSPVPGNVLGTIQLAATATAPAGLANVQFTVDGINVGPALTAAPFTVNFNTTTVPDGAHTVAATATDINNVTATASVVVTVRNTPVTGTDAHYLDLDGVDDYLQVGDANPLSFGNGTADTPFTFEMWFRPDQMVRHQLIGKWGETTNQEYRFQVASGTFRLDLRDNSAGATASVFTQGAYGNLVGAWHHIAVTYDGRGGATAADGITLYVDGVSQPLFRTNNPAYVAMENLADPLQIGREGPFWRQLDGGLDDIRLWSVARSAAQIQGSMSSELTGTETGLRAYWRLNEGAGLLAGDATANALTATLINGPVWTAGGPLGTAPPDTTPPTISGVVTSNITSTGGTISFTTNETTTASVGYTTAAACPCTTVASAATGTAHSVTLTGLTPATQYTFFVTAVDTATNATTSPAFLLTTLAANVDTTPPTVAIVSPVAGTVAGTLTLQANASDNVGVVSVQFRVDGVNVGAADTTAPYSTSWNSTTVADGVHTISVQARDAANNVGTASVTVTVQNVPVNSTPNYLDIDGVDDYLQVADANGLSFGNGTADTPFTFEMWIRPDQMVRHQLIGKWGESTNQEYKFQIASGTFRLDLRDNSANATVSVFSVAAYPGLVGAWHHVAVTYDGRGGATAADGLTLYVDGVSQALYRQNAAGYVAMENLADPVQIGREGPFWKQFDGGLDDIRLWNVARTAAQIQAARSVELTGTEAGLVAYWRLNDGTGTLATDATGHGYVATLVNGPVWTAGGAFAPAGPDTTPPVISGIAASAITQTGATIGFTTNETTTASVAFSTTGVCPCTTVTSAATGTTHSVVLTGLAAATQYTYRVTATDTAGNATTSANQVFTTLANNVDVTPPTVTITAPTGGTVLGTISVQANATDLVGVVSVQFQVDGVNLGAADTVAPYSVSWNTTTVTDGLHTITAQARDAANNVGTASVTVTVQNVPVSTSPHYLDLDGNDDYVQVADANALSFGNGTADTPFTFEMWIRPDQMVRHQLLGKWGESTNQEYKLQVASGTFRLDIRDNSAAATVSVFTQAAYPGLVGAWHHLAATYDGRGGATAADGITIYLDGVAQPVFRINHAGYVAMENLADPLQIGREGPFWKQFDGGIDDIRLWNVARTGAQILSTMNVELAGSEAGLVAYWKLNEGTGVLAASAAAATLPASLLNGPVWMAGNAFTPAVPDTTPPVISGITAGSITANTATISFTTNETTTASVAFSTTGVCPCTTVNSATSGTAHTVSLTGLAAATQYTFRVTATDLATNATTSAPFLFTTQAASVDNVPPTVTMVSPLGGTVSGTVTLQANASDNVGVTSVQFLIDGVALGAADTVAPYTATWNTTTATAGSHTISVQARDLANNVGTTSVVVTVANLPAGTSPFFLELDGIDDYVQVNDANALSFGNGAADTPFTFEMWLRPDQMVRHQLVGKWGETTNQEYRFQVASGTLRLDLRDNSANATVSVFTMAAYTGLVGTWHHVAVTYDGRGGATAADGVTIYVDGVAQAVYRVNNAAYVAMENLADPLQIGREGPFWKVYDGGFNELRLWSVARTAAELLGSMNVELTGSETGLRGYWRFNEGTGTLAGDATTNANTATLNLGPVWTVGP